MKIIFIILILFNVENDKLEEFLGMNKSQMNTFFDCKFENNLENKKFYYAQLEKGLNYYGVKCNFLSFTTDNYDEINSITIHFNEILNLEFYNFFNESYGKPKSVKIIKAKRELFSKIKNTSNDSKTFHQNLKQFELIVEDGEIKDKPYYICWEMDSYKIEALIRYKEKTSDITFSKL